MIKNILKVVLLGVVGFALLIYLTAEKPEILANDNVSSLSRTSLPAQFELVSQEKKVSKDELFKEAKKTLIIVGNHDSLAIVKDLKKHFTIDMPYVMVANISAAPWFVKKMFIPSKLEELNEGTNIPMIYDFDGFMVKALNLDDSTKTKFFAYILDENGKISLIHSGEVKEGALDGSMNEEEIKTSLKAVIDAL